MENNEKVIVKTEESKKTNKINWKDLLIGFVTGIAATIGTSAIVAMISEKNDTAE